jgi:copper chaperone CopZ
MSKKVIKKSCKKCNKKVEKVVEKLPNITTKFYGVIRKGKLDPKTVFQLSIAKDIKLEADEKWLQLEVKGVKFINKLK